MVGGCSGIIRVINCATEKIAKVRLVYISIAKLNEAWFAQNNTSVTLLIVCIIISIYNILQSLVGHGGSINEIRTQALKPSLIISASKVRKYTYFFNDFRLYGHALFFVFRLFQ